MDLPTVFLVKHDRQVRVLDGEENIVHVRTHVTLLEQRRAEKRPLRPLGNLLLGVILVIRVGPRIEVLQTCVEDELCVNALAI